MTSEKKEKVNLLHGLKSTSAKQVVRTESTRQ